MSHATLLTLLLPPQAYARNAQPLQIELQAEGRALDVAERDGLQLAAAISPFFAEYTLPDWERVCALTPPSGAGYQQRLQAVLAKLAATGGLSMPYFKRLASSLGYRIDIVEPQPFRAGINRAGDRLQVADIIWVWQVVIHAAQVHAWRFRAGQAAASEALTSFGDPVLETVFRELKPAHTFVYFAYQEG
ncbi:YmfQ family protein [Aquitalea sp. ASV15]|uniref:YmfQ family protein n=1 Tax=Aquitalea sp. ASV15 TaxID=2795104 RepID=UPI0018EDA5F5|nr:putative phage tail protein [Aquitalea sp. ASV15]